MKKVGRGRPKGSTNKKKNMACCAEQCTAPESTKSVSAGGPAVAETQLPGSNTSAFELAVRFSGVVQDVAKIAQGLNQAISGMNDMGSAISRDMQALAQRVTNLEQAISLIQSGGTQQQAKLSTETPKQQKLHLAAKEVGIPVVPEPVTSMSLKDII